MKSKTFKTLDEQIDILTKKGLVVEDIETAKTVLLRENYFFLSGYRHLFMRPDDNKTYLEGTTFNELYSMFLFDRQIRNIIFKNILIDEFQDTDPIQMEIFKIYAYKRKSIRK